MEMEGEGRSEMEVTDLEVSADAIDGAVIFHVVTDILGFILYMHQQIPSILQDISLEFDALHSEYNELATVLAQSEMKASLRRIHASRKRQVKQGIKRLDKLMKSVTSVKTALQLLISEIPNISEVFLVIGASPVRPQHVYELCFSHGHIVFSGATDFNKSRTAEGVSKKAIRALILKGAGSSAYAGPSKLFLLIKARSSFNMPLHFLPKRDFRYNRKIVPLRLRIKWRAQDLEIDAPNHETRPASSTKFIDSTSDDWIWFQCRHVIKGLACKTSPEE